MRIDELRQAIIAHLSDNPQDGDSLILACTTGLKLALAKAEERAGECSTAMLAALILADSKRLAAPMRQTLYELIAKSVDHPNAAPIERKFAQFAKDNSNG